MVKLEIKLARPRETGLTLRAEIYYGGQLIATVSMTEGPADSALYAGQWVAPSVAKKYVVAFVDSTNRDRGDGILRINEDGEEIDETGEINNIGAGASPLTWTLTVGDTNSGETPEPLADADVWITRDLQGLHVIDRKRTNTNGRVRFFVDKFEVDGVTQIPYYGFAQKDEVVSVEAAVLYAD